MRRALAVVTFVLCGCRRDSSVAVRPEPVPSAASEAAAIAPPTRAPVAPDAGPPDARALALAVADASFPECDGVEADAKRRFAAWAKDGDMPFREPYAGKLTRTPDLDGDGIPEIEWDFSEPPITSEAHVYRGGACPTAHLATLTTGGVVLDPGTHGGHRDFRTEDYAAFCEGNPCGCTPEIRHYVWSGAEYREDPKQRSAGAVTPCGDP